MNILFISTWFPYPQDNGARIRVYNLIKALSRHHNVSLISVLQDDSRENDIRYLSDVCDVVSCHRNHWYPSGRLVRLKGLFSLRPSFMVSSRDKRMEESVARCIETLRPDIIVASQFVAMDYVPHRVDCPVLFEELEVGWLHGQCRNGGLLARISWLARYYKWRYCVSDLLARCDAYTCVSEQEKKLIAECYQSSKMGIVLQNAIDHFHYSPNEREPIDGYMIYNGALTYGANRDAVSYYVQEIYPIVSRLSPGVMLHVTGKLPSEGVGQIADCPGVELTGYVDDIRFPLRRSQMCIVPLREGGGSRIKILEAMAAGIPVVSTSVGAEGLCVENGQHLLIADTAEDFACAIARLRSDHSLSSMLSANARRLIEENYSWSAVGERFCNLIDSMVHKNMEQPIL